jgi:hypothetical protein
LCFRNTDASAFAAVQATGEEFDFLAGTESLDVLFLLHGGTDVRRVSDGHFDGFWFVRYCRSLVFWPCVFRWSYLREDLRRCCWMVMRKKSAIVLVFGALGGGVVGFGWVEEEKREQEKKCRSPYIQQHVLLLHLDGMILRRAEAVAAQHKQGLE